MGTSQNGSITPPLQETATILLVEDEPDLADLFETWLTDSYDVIVANTGETALDVLDDSIDLVLLDRRLPGISGDDVLSLIKNERPELPVAMVSAITPGFGVIDTGIEDYLVKPVEEADLLELVADLLNRQSQADPTREIARLEAKKSSLEAAFNSSELQRQTAYQELVDRIKELQELTE